MEFGEMYLLEYRYIIKLIDINRLKINVIHGYNMILDNSDNFYRTKKLIRTKEKPMLKLFKRSF